MYYNDYLKHYGVLGMHWGQRKADAQRKKYGMSKKEAKKSLPDVRDPNTESFKLNRKFYEEAVSEYKKRGLASIEKKTMDYFIKGEYAKAEASGDIHEKLRGDMMVEVGKKYVDQMNLTRLKEMKYDGSTKQGLYMLEAYRLKYSPSTSGPAIVRPASRRVDWTAAIPAEKRGHGLD